MAPIPPRSPPLNHPPPQETPPIPPPRCLRCLLGWVLLWAAAAHALPAPNGGPEDPYPLNRKVPDQPRDPASVALYAAICAGDTQAVRTQIAAQPQLLDTRYTVTGIQSRPLLYPSSLHAQTVGWGLRLSNAPPLQIAAALSNLETVELLLAAGADPQVQDFYGQSLLTYALRNNGSPQIATRLYAAGVRPTAADHFGDWLYNQCAQAAPNAYNTSYEEPIAAWLLDHGISMDNYTWSGTTAWNILAQRGLYTEFLDYDWSDQPGTNILYHIHRNQPKLPDFLQLFLFALVLVAVAFTIRRTQAQVQAQVARRAAVDPATGLSARAAQRLDRWQARLKHYRLFADLAPLGALYRRSERLRRWTALPLTAGILAATSIALDPLLVRMPYTDSVGLYAGAIVLAGGLQFFAAPLWRLLVSTALAVLALIGAPALAYQGFLMHTHLHQTGIFALDVVTATLLLCLTGICLALVRVHWQLWRAEAAIRRRLRQAHRDEDTTQVEPTGQHWDRSAR